MDLKQGENRRESRLKAAKPERESWQEIPLEHYSALFAKLDTAECAARCNLNFSDGAFSVRFTGENLKVRHPDFKIENEAGGDGTNIYEKILVLRFLCEGKFVPFGGKSLSYREIPWGEVYFRNFEGRCIKRLAATFANSPDKFVRIMENPALKASRIAGGAVAYRFEFFSNLYMSFFLWEGDDEFPASAQILFDDNVPAAFSAEDLASMGEVVIKRLKTYGA